jgi:hypothetical protein
VEFEDGLSIPVMKKGQLFTKIFNWKSKISEKVKPPAPGVMCSSQNHKTDQ